MPRTLGPRLIGRDRTRLRVGAGKGKRVKTSEGVWVDIDTDPMLLYVADGLAAASQRILDVAIPNAPDDPTTTGSRIRDSAQFGVYAFGKVMTVEGSVRDFKKPRSFRPSKDGVDAIVTFRSPLHHFHELGTEKMEAHAYLGPARAIVTPQIPGILAAHWPKDGPDR